MERFKISFNAASAIGSRELNQDVFLVDDVISVPNIAKEQYLVDEYISSTKIKVFAVCDGIGSFKSSGLAAEAALQAIRNKMEEDDKQNNDDVISQGEENTLVVWVKEVVEIARKAMLSYCSENGCNGASSTLTLLAIKGNEYVFANLGDSPAFLRKDNGKCSELSIRHNLATFKKFLNEEPGEGDERVLLYHLGEKGIDIRLALNIVSGKIEEKDAFILCTDGVVNALEEEEISELLSQRNPSYVFVKKAIKDVKADNCTAITIYIDAEVVQE